MESASLPTASTIPVPAPPVPRGLVSGEHTALVMTFLALFGCLAALFVYTGNSLWQGTAVETSEYTGQKEDYTHMIFSNNKETFR